MQVNGGFSLGVNYWPRGSGPAMWRRFDPEAISDDLEDIRGLGIAAVRGFLFLPDFMPTPDRVEPVMLERFARFLDLCAAARLRVWPTLLVGHMSGENWDPPWRDGRDLYTDPTVLAAFERLIDAVVPLGASHPALEGWVLTNEMPVWGGSAPEAVVTGWCRRLLGAVARRDPGHPAVVGDGSWGGLGARDGYRPERLGELQPFLGAHVYLEDVDPVRHAFTAEAVAALLARYGYPVLLEEFGSSGAFAGQRERALYTREVLGASLAAGLLGAWVWCYADFDLAADRPYLHHPFELSFGLVDARGRHHAAADEVRRFADLLAELGDVADFRPRPGDVAIVVPEAFDTDFPFHADGTRDRLLVLIETYTAMRLMGQVVDFVRESAPLDGYRLVLFPAASHLLATTWAGLASVAQARHVYISYFAGDRDFQTGPWSDGLEATAGIVSRRRYGIWDLPPDTVELLEPGGAIVERVDTRGLRPASPAARSYLPAAPRPGTEVLLTDGEGRPALFRTRTGRGGTLFLTLPFEYYAARTGPSGPPRPGMGLYRRILEAAGLAARPPGPDDPLVVWRERTRPDGERLLFVQNHGWEEAAFTAPPDARPVFPGAGDRLAPKETRVYRAGRSGGR